MNATNQILADYEQMETTVTGDARVVSAYYQQLKKDGLPSPLIQHLVIEFARQWWTNQLDLNSHHIYNHFGEDEE